MLWVPLAASSGARWNTNSSTQALSPYQVVDIAEKTPIWYFYIFLTFFFVGISLLSHLQKTYVCDVFLVVCSCLVVFVDRNWGGVACLHIFGSDRPLFWRESASGIGVSAFFLSRVTWPPKKNRGGRGPWESWVLLTSEAGDFFSKYPTKIILIWSSFIYPKHPGMSS